MFQRLSWIMWIGCGLLSCSANMLPATAATTLADVKPGHVQPHAGAQRRGPTFANDIHLGFTGHFACKAFSGLERRLCEFASEGNAQKARGAVQAGANVNAVARNLIPRGMTMLHVAIWYHWSLHSIAILLECGADVDAKDAAGDTPLIYATRDPVTGNLACVQLLLEHNADVNVHDKRGMTPLMYAAVYSQTTSIVSALIKAGADVHAVDHQGWTALLHASRARRGAAEKATLLLAAGADVNHLHHLGGTALQNACLHGNAACARVLLHAGAQINHADQAGWTPLLCAIMSANVELVDWLLAADADPDHADRLGRTPLALAQRTGHVAIAKRLRQRVSQHYSCTGVRPPAGPASNRPVHASAARP